MRTIPLYKTSFLLIVWILLCFSFTSCNVESTPESYSLKRELEDLDRCVNKRDYFFSRKNNNISVLHHYLRDTTISNSRRYSLCYSMAEAFYTSHYDSTVYYLNQCVEIARDLKDNVSWNKANTKLGNVYVSSGNYLKAFDALFIKIDSNHVAPTIRADYYEAMYKMSKQMIYADNVGQLDGVIPSTEYYRNKLLDLLEYPLYRKDILLVDRLVEDNELNNASLLNLSLLNKLDKSSYEYGKRCFRQYEIEKLLNHQKESIYWLIQASKLDMYNAVRDYSALNILSRYLIDLDLKRSYSYSQIAIQDAVAYNSRLRPFQLTQFMQQVELANNKNLIQKHRTSVIFVVLMILAISFVIWQSYNLMIHSQKLSKALSMLRAKNDELLEANSIKEHYIAQFFTILSDKIEYLKDYDSALKKEIRYGKIDNVIDILSNSKIIQHETEAFYKIFDETFLSIYPSFVNDFNSLMRDDCKVVIKDGELLNTKLRIFAMVRLGISNSDTIAKLLRYSVRTIYNNKVKARNGANVPRDEFEKYIMKIGGFNAERP